MRRLLIIGCGDVGARLIPLARPRYRVYALTRDGAQCAALRARGVTPIVGDLDKPHTLSALAAVVYILATLALIFAGRRGWYLVAWIAISFELAGVLIVGTLSYLVPDIFGHPSVWSYFGGLGPDGYIGYLFVPLVLLLFPIIAECF